ncbi:DUF1289 domain-containing protein [Motilimonas pumila]|uniref:DUF1289 domain-containing protein n=1 Tax=Motilimonas pumila TaxID=2303987 RepID=A0A418YH58_9GAMM|nr:DUF1289 domain-containing protein [Motilimonas pumila]RJG49426.1 DUF1289 domain-containing protein [Motilimonas pumila]
MTKALSRIESPCIRHCCLNQQDVCMGCFRTLAEILAWHQSSNDERLTILSNAKLRAEQKAQARFATTNANKQE